MRGKRRSGRAAGGVTIPIFIAKTGEERAPDGGGETGERKRVRSFSFYLGGKGTSAV